MCVDVEPFKASWFACGSGQKRGVNYNYTLAPLLPLDSARKMLELSVISRNYACHSDIPAAYTKAKIESDVNIFVFPPKGMTPTVTESELKSLRDNWTCFVV